MQDSAHSVHEPIYIQLPQGNKLHNDAHAYDDVIKKLQDALESNRFVVLPGTRTNILYIAINHFSRKKSNGLKFLETVLKYFCYEPLVNRSPDTDPIKLLSKKISFTRPKTLLGYLGTETLTKQGAFKSAFRPHMAPQPATSGVTPNLLSSGET